MSKESPEDMRRITLPDGRQTIVTPISLKKGESNDSCLYSLAVERCLADSASELILLFDNITNSIRWFYNPRCETELPRLPCNIPQGFVELPLDTPLDNRKNLEGFLAYEFHLKAGSLGQEPSTASFNYGRSHRKAPPQVEISRLDSSIGEGYTFRFSH